MVRSLTHGLSGIPSFQERTDSTRRTRGSGASRVYARENEIKHKGSVFTYILFLPPIAELEEGYYCNGQVVLAFALLLLAGTLQVSLTFIAGTYIVNQQAEVRSTLVQNVGKADLPLLSMVDFEIGKMHDLGFDIKAPVTLPIRHTLEQFAKVTKHGEEGDETEKCCAEATCYAQGYACCAWAGKGRRSEAPDTGVVDIRQSERFNGIGDVVNASGDDASEGGRSFLQHYLSRKSKRKPGGGGGKAKAKTRQSDEDGNRQQISPLCADVDGVLICMPPSFALVEAWDELDTNKDGVWTLEEAKDDYNNLGCRIGTLSEDVFRAACRGLVLMNRDSDHEVPATISSHTAMPRAYFEMWRGIFAVCINFDDAMCGSLIVGGAFNGAIDPKFTWQVGGMVDLDTAMAYCQRLLTPGGICDAALPGRYVMHRHRVKEKCGKPVLHSGPRYINPHNTHDTMSLLDVSWSNYDSFSITHSLSFQFFMGLILAVWYVNLVDELKDIIHLWDFICNFPVLEHWSLFAHQVQKASYAGVEDEVDEKVEDEEPNSAQVDEDEEKEPESRGRGASTASSRRSWTRKSSDAVTRVVTEIVTIARPHKVVVTFMACVRTTVFCYLAFAGTVFLLSNHSFVDLLLNALAMAFLFELDEFLYFFLVPEETKAKMDTAEPLKFRSSLPNQGFSAMLLAKHSWGLVLIPIVCFIVVYEHDRKYTDPILTALGCVCLKIGDTCLAPQIFTEDWWDQYWAHLSSHLATVW